ncbi:diacylglycerol kinase family lipid kinase [Ktedonosporobacter rubrisoli]|uniref:Diacylglycerol kinase family lipid kinase n=1 Tax=Ktedonosporobacter rubrisoli TaxID=2509675 RepID=A0A4P6JIY8_KTERU|nr:diacylglycerol kinase family protein [Ktedonosporobacter rubrisoli]QBD75049.1 diacylglycerol kinase family lipid kinase [Ktedonosporobacter rubrisoli]
MEVANTLPENKQRTKALLIANPTAGSYTQHIAIVEDTLDYLRQHGWQIELELTRGPGDGRRIGQEAVKQHLDAVIVLGGDGTLNEVIQELAGSETALGVLPAGTVNVWAREMLIPINNYEAAREILVNGQMRRVDLGKVEERYFLLMATIGFDAEVTRIVERHKHLGILDYILKGTWLGLGYPNFTAVLQTGSKARRVRAFQIIFGNTQLYAGAIKFTWRARCDDGLLDVCIVSNQNILGRLGVLADFLLGRAHRTQWVQYYETASEIKVHTSPAVAIQVDGDPAGYTAKKGFPPTCFTIVPKALKVIVPAQAPEGIFASS